jgi:RNA polymerase sigma-70 factor, ECF subfamily
MADATGLPWEELHGNLRAFISRRVRNQADVDDLVQRVLLQIVKGIGSLRDGGRLHAWVYKTARNAILDHYRSAPVRREVPSGAAADFDGEAAGVAFEDDERTALSELAACMAPMIDRLPDAYRQAVIWADLEGVTQAEAARRAGVSLPGMKSRVQRGRQQLKAVLEACCRVDLDRRGAIAAYEPQRPDACGSCGCQRTPSS